MEKLKSAFLNAVTSTVTVDHPVKQSITTLIITALAVQARALIVPIVMLVVLMIGDFITGMRAAAFRGEKISSAKYFIGLEKKVYILFLVGIGLALDVIVMYSVQTLGFSVTLPVAIATVVTVWLVLNEVISILENLQDIGVVMPKWLLPFIRNIKSKVEEKAPATEEEPSNDK